MNNKSDEPDMIPAIKPAKDEVMSYRRNSQREAPKQSSFNGMLVFVLVFMAILMGVGGYTLYELQLQLEVSNNLLQKAGDERTRLEEELAVSGVRSSNTFKKMNDQQQANVSEIRKLWAIAHQQNKPKIEQLANTLKRVDSTNKRLDTSSTKLTAGLTQVTQEFNALSSGMIEVRQNLVDDNAEMTTQVSIVRGQVQDQSDLVEKNNRRLASLAQKIKSLEEDIETFDRYRRQTNKKLLDLQKQLRSEVVLSPTASTGG